MCNERTPHLQELIRLSSKATLLIPRLVFDEKYDPDGKYKSMRDSLKYLKNDEKLLIHEKNVGGDFVEITIALKEGDG